MGGDRQGCDAARRGRTSREGLTRLRSALIFLPDDGSVTRFDGVVAALGVFAERGRGPDGRRIGRFQHVVTAPSMRRRGWAGRLLEHASRYAFDRLDVDTLVIMADEHDAPRRV